MKKTLRQMLLASALLASSAAAAAAVQTVVWEGEGVPTPSPLATQVDVAAFIFPGWGVADPASIGAGGEWPSLFPDPSVRPLLGFYNDALPVVNDWHIYWARQFGVSLFIHNWYWNNGQQILVDQLEQGFLQAQHREHMDFAIQWSNHPIPQAWGANTPLRFDRQAMLDVTDYWIANYFHQPNYRKINGRPLVIIFDPLPVIAQNGGVAGWKVTLGQMNARMAAAGLGPLFLAATNFDAQAMKAAGFDAITGYSTHGIPPVCPAWRTGPGYRVPFAYMVESTHRVYKMFERQHGVLDMIVPSGTGWDDSYRHPQMTGTKFTTGFSPASFEAMISASLQAVPAQGLRMVVFDAWNEWTEGSYLEPTKRFGFGMLEAVARTYGAGPVPEQVFIPSVDDAIALSNFPREQWLAMWNLPLDTPLPPHINLPMVPSGVRCLGLAEEPAGGIVWQWAFGSGASPTLTNGQTIPSPDGFSYIPTTTDPQLSWTIPPMDVSEITAISFELRVNAPTDDPVELFHAPPGESFVADRAFSMRAPDGADWVTVGVDVADYTDWSGQIGAIRLDIGVPGQQVTVRRARIQGSGSPVGWKVR